MTLSLQTRFPEIGFSCNHNSNVGTIKISNSSNSQFRILTDDTIVSLQGIDWYGDGCDHPYSPDVNNLRSINEVFRNSVQSPSETSYESGFIDLLNVHNIYIHSPDFGHYSAIGVREESSIINKVQVSSSFVHLILDSVVAQHDKSRCKPTINQNNGFVISKCTWRYYRSTWGPLQLQFDICNH